MSQNNKIAKNTIFLYIRMMFIMIVTLFTSRIIIEALGIDNYGIYQSVGGIVGLLSFLNGAISASSSRFLTYEIGKGNKERLNKVFSTLFSSHIIIAFFIVIIAELIGKWMINDQLVIPENRIDAAYWVYQFSILTAIITIIQIPLTAAIISYEKMGVYAYISIFEAMGRLSIAYAIKNSNGDNLILFAGMLFVLQLLLTTFYLFYCKKQFTDIKSYFGIYKNLFKEIFKFSGWSLISSLSIALNAQGTTIITNLFYGPAVVTARALTIQVNMAINQFVNNFRLAVNPQIVKRLAIGEQSSSKHLLLESTKYSFFLIYILGLPLLLSTPKVLHLWLTEVPPYTIIFVQLIIIESFFLVFDTSFYAALYAVGDLKLNALISPIVGFIRFPAVYYLFYLGYSPVVLSYAGIITAFMLGFIIKPILLHKVANYNFHEIYKMILSCMRVVAISIPLPLLLYFNLNQSFEQQMILLLSSVTIIGITIYYYGIDRIMRKQMLFFIKNQFNHSYEKQ